MTIDFKLFVNKYFNKRNPATNKVWKRDEIIADSANIQSVNENGVAASDAELNEAYQHLHPNQYPITTPFGITYALYTTNNPVMSKTLGELSMSEATEFFNKLLESR
jgi:hypothetical protein